MIRLLVVAIVLLVLDAGWLIANSAYHRKVIAALQGSPLQIRWAPAIATYALIIVAVWFFAVRTATSWTEAAGRGALLGAAMYGVYDLTNYATLSRYPVSYAVSDLIWGTLLCSATAIVAFYAGEQRSNGVV